MFAHEFLLSGDPCWHFRLIDETLLADGGVVVVAAGVGETLAAVIALERLLPGMDSLMHLDVERALEGFAAVGTLEFEQVLMVGHVALELAEGGELFVAQTTRLQNETLLAGGV